MAAPSVSHDLVIRAHNVSKTYQTNGLAVKALQNVTFEAHQGEMVAVMGPSGCGKTTLLNCLSGLDQIDKGQIHIEGKDVGRMGDDELTRFRAERMGFIFQSFNLLPVLSAAENVELPLLVSGATTREARTRAQEALVQVGLGHRLRHKPKELSGGEQQRVAIARSIVNRPAIIWADEPTGNLDSTTSRSIIDLLRDLNRNTSQTYVIVTHAPEVAAECHRTVQMINGTIVATPPRPRAKTGR